MARYIKGDYFQVPNRTALSTLDCESQVVYIWMCARADKKGQCFPSISNLCKTCHLSRQTVIDRVKVLLNKGFIRVSREKGKSNKYQLMLLTSQWDRVDQSSTLTTPVYALDPNNNHRTININNKVNIRDYKPEFLKKLEK